MTENHLGIEIRVGPNLLTIMVLYGGSMSFRRISFQLVINRLLSFKSFISISTLLFRNFLFFLLFMPSLMNEEIFLNDNSSIMKWKKVNLFIFLTFQISFLYNLQFFLVKSVLFYIFLLKIPLSYSSFFIHYFIYLRTAVELHA